MTALDKYQRLESGGIWRADAEAQRRDVVISFGDATLVIADGTARPLAHWSLPAIVRRNPGEHPALYAPDDHGGELVEISDDLMIDAIEEVRAALDKARPKPGKLRHWITGGIVVAAMALAIIWLPGALIRQTLAVVPFPKRVEIGATMLGYLQGETGAVCNEPRANDASKRLTARLFGAQTLTQIIVVPDLPAGALALPGDLVVVDYALLRSSDDPAAAAGFILGSRAALTHMDPLEELLHNAGLGVTFRLLTTGEIPATILQDAAAALLTENAQDAPADLLRDALADAQVPQAPFLAVADARTGTMPDLGGDPLQGTDVPALLTDSDWVSLQNICDV
ncbi:hypothetical protein SLH49_09395 [Cognatiyoonia sp. IB215446]|uniref:hypothetical protein n=1 Tax=Cognatiyoonia sp. IB215446 TaxID=3097355 RepID=UPI002A173BC9|nr:hypothetical protein [Cognatiyoonia sp. IB215446]MDX8348201.1 hypothetical protein [Cognatiyoonia sp. IB215446]